MARDIEHTARAVLANSSERFLDLVSIAGLSPKTSFRHIDLGGVSFEGQDLSGFDFTGADLRGCNFIGALLDNAIFDGAELDCEGQAAVSLASSLAKPAHKSQPFVPDIYVDLVAESEDFLQAVDMLRALEQEDYIPSHCFLHVLNLASSEATALRVFESWKDFPGAGDLQIAQRLCARITTRSAATIVAERLDQWNAAPHDLLISLGSKEAKWAFIGRLVERGRLTNEVLQKLPTTVFQEEEIEDTLSEFRKLSDRGVVALDLAHLIRWGRTYRQATAIFEQLVVWNRGLSRDRAARSLLARAETAEQAMHALSISSNPRDTANALRAIRRLPVREARNFLLTATSPLDPAIALREISLRSSLDVADHLQLITFALQRRVPYPKSSIIVLSRLRPRLADLILREAERPTKSDWANWVVHCWTGEEHESLWELHSLFEERVRETTGPTA